MNKSFLVLGKSLVLSIIYLLIWLCCSRVRCAQTDGNGSTANRTVLHDLYEKEGQSPWYDNLCRPVTDLLPLIASGVRGVTSNPAVTISFNVIFCVSICMCEDIFPGNNYAEITKDYIFQTLIVMCCFLYESLNFT